MNLVDRMKKKYDNKTMSDTNSIKEEIKVQNSKAAKLPPKQRAKHFWYYYRIPFFVFLGVLAFATYMILHYTVFAPKPYAFSAYALNTTYAVNDITNNNETDLDRFLDGFCKYMNFDLSKTRVEINTALTINPTSGDNLTLANDMNLIATGQAGDVDVLIGSPELVEYYIPNGFYKEPLSNCLPADFYEYLSENHLIYYYTDPKDGQKYELGIRIKDAARMEETGLYTGTDIKYPVASIVTAYSPRVDTAVAFFEYLFDYPNCAK